MCIINSALYLTLFKSIARNSTPNIRTLPLIEEAAENQQLVEGLMKGRRFGM
jgi:hypothetical protein